MQHLKGENDLNFLLRKLHVKNYNHIIKLTKNIIFILYNIYYIIIKI